MKANEGHNNVTVLPAALHLKIINHCTTISSRQHNISKHYKPAKHAEYKIHQIMGILLNKLCSIINSLKGLLVNLYVNSSTCCGVVPGVNSVTVIMGFATIFLFCPPRPATEEEAVAFEAEDVFGP